MVKLPTPDVVDVEWFAGTTLSFDLKFWLDDDKTEPHPVESFQCSVYDGSTEVFDLDDYATIDVDESNVVHVLVPPEDSEELVTRIAKWRGVTTFVDGEVEPSFVGKAQIWGQRVD